MEVVDESSAMLSNYEVFVMLQELQKGQNTQRRHSKSKEPLATISYSTLKYLEKSPCNYQSPEVIANFTRLLEPYKLTKAEKLQLLNQRPQSAVEIQLMIEESEERLTEDQIDELLDLVTTHLPSPVPDAPLSQTENNCGGELAGATQNNEEAMVT